MQMGSDLAPTMCGIECARAFVGRNHMQPSHGIPCGEDLRFQRPEKLRANTT